MSVDRAAGAHGPEADTVERLVADCLRERMAPDSDGVEEICREHPHHVDVVRRRIAMLSSYGLLGQGPDDGGLGRAPSIPGHRVVAPLGSGGMGVVWLVEECATGRRLALKTADPRVPWTERMRERFRREVAAVSRLDHPHVVPIFAAGEADGLPFFTMEYVEGATLADLVRELRESEARPDRLTESSLREAWARLQEREPEAGSWGGSHVECVCRIGGEIAEALEHLHAHGVIHRDVKPANILIDGRGRARLFDLGLVHLDDQPALTLTGDFAGSPHYASPEQISGSARALDGRTDVYSLGVTLYEALALRPPFQAENTPQLLDRIRTHDAPPLRAASTDVPRDLETIVATCLEKAPGHRYASAAELAEDLARLRRFQPVRARPVRGVRRLVRRARRRPAWAVAGFLVAAAVVAAPLALWQHERSLRSERDRANRAAENARREAAENLESAEFLESLLLAMEESGAPGDQRTVQNLLALAIDRVEDASSAGATTRANLMTTVARVLSGMGRHAEAIPLLDRAFQIRRRELGEEHAEAAEVLLRLGEEHFAMGNTDEALALTRRSLDVLDANESDRVTTAGLALTHMLRATGALDEASARLEAVEAELRSGGREASGEGARAVRERGWLHLARGDHEAAVARMAEALETLRGLGDAPLADVAEGLEALGAARVANGDATLAHAAWIEALGLLRKATGDRSPALVGLLERLTELEASSSGLERARHLDLLARNRSELGLDGAGEGFEAAAAAFRALEPTPANDLGSCLTAWAGSDEDLARARASLREAHELARTPESTRESWRLRCVQGLLELEGGSAASTTMLLDEGLAWLERWSEPRDAEWQDLARRHARLLVRHDREPEAVRLLLEERAGDAAVREELVLYRFGSTESGAAFQDGITALQSGRHEQAAAAFRRCLAIRPGDSVAAYNLACAFALMGDTDAAFDALLQSADAGFSYRLEAIEGLRGDGDLARLRSDPRFEALLERMTRQLERAERYAAQPALYLPPSLEGAESFGVLVVLHGDGETKEDVVRGPWRAVANEVGYALVAPSGHVPVGPDPANGVRWAEEIETYADNPTYFERSVRASLQSIREEHPVDPERIVLAGHGLGGTVAFNVAIHSAEVVNGVVLVDAAVHEGLASRKAPHLGSMGLRAALLPDVTRVPPGVAPDVEPPAWAAGLFGRMREWEIGATIGTWPSSERSSERSDVLASAVRWLDGRGQ